MELTVEDKVKSFEKEYNALLDSQKYIAKSDYVLIKDKYNGCADSIEAYSRLEFDIDLHNERFIRSKLAEYKEYFDRMFFDIDPSVILDEDQRRAVIADEDYCLVIAGAGAGKTTTMAAKVKYLVEKLGMRPEDIVLVSFTNKAVDELKERINTKLRIPAKVTTFHAFGYDILRNVSEYPPTVNINEYNIIYNIFEKKIYQSSNLLQKLILFFGCYLDVPDDILNYGSIEEYHTMKSEQDLETLRSKLGEYNSKVTDLRSKHVRTIRGEFLRSVQEVQIANFLYLNGIEYEYEKPYPYAHMDYTSESVKLHKHRNGLNIGKKPYTPDFNIAQGDNHCYIEHFGISEDGRNSIYTPMQLSKYIRGINFKRRLHEEYHTSLITTYGRYANGRQLLDVLEEELQKKGFVVKPRDNEEIYRKLVNTGKDKYIIRFILLMIEFIKKFKTNGFEQGAFMWLKRRADSVRTQLFLDIAAEVYSIYMEELEKRGCIDFEDMINEAEKTLNEIYEKGIKISCKYIIIDEYQDIARQRFNLTKKLADITGAKITAVGDDWQSVFAFAGSDITLFTKFLKLMGYGKELKITHTYRNSQELIDIAGGFVQKNPEQIRKRLISPKHIERPIVIKAYDDRKNLINNRTCLVEKTIGEILAEYGKGSSILLIGRYNFDEYYLLKTEKFTRKAGGKLICLKYPMADITYMTAHSSKGLGFDSVIIINAAEDKYGFPSQIEDDPVMKLVTVEGDSMSFSEERRLFYVAMTRTKNRVYIIAPAGRPSRFVEELIRDYGIERPQTMSFAFFEGNSVRADMRERCPDCGFPLTYMQNGRIGLQLWMCTNEPEVCDFMTNDRKTMGDIFLCPECMDGYMVVRKNRDSEDRFFGCTNHKPDGTGCNCVMPINQG